MDKSKLPFTIVGATGVEALIGEVEAPAKAEAGVVKIVDPFLAPESHPKP